MSIATGYFNDDDEPVISFTDRELEQLPGSVKELQVLIAAARRCYQILDPKKLNLTKQECWTHYVRSNYCAFQLLQRNAQNTVDNLSRVAVKIGLLYGEETLPILLSAYDACRSSWTDNSVDCFLGVHIMLDDLGDKLYPDSFKREVYHQLGDIIDAL